MMALNEVEGAGQQDSYRLVEQIFKKIDGAYSKATIRAYRVDIIGFVDFCESKEFACFPGSVQAVIEFIEDCAVKGCSVAFIRRKVTSISSFHRFCRLPVPSIDIDVQLAMRRLVMQKGRAPKQAHGMSQKMFNAMIAVTSTDTLGSRDRLLLHLAYATLCRRHELVALLIEDLKFLEDGTGLVHQRAGKADRLKHGRWIHLQKPVVDAINQWLGITGFKEGPILRGVRKNDIASLGPFNPGAVGRTYKRLARKAGFSEALVAGISGHSTRVGAAQELLQTGASLLQVMHRGGWSLPQSVMRYVRNADMLHDYPMWKPREYESELKSPQYSSKSILEEIPKIGPG